MWSFLWRPGWILTHLLVVVVVATMVTAGFWQLRRLDERRASNATIEARQDEPPATLEALLPAGPAAEPAQAEAVAFRSVEVAGRYLPDEQVLVRNRTYGGTPGYWVLTPLRLAGGDVVAVNRGWVPFATTDPDGAGWEAFAPPPGEVRASGMARDGQVRSTGVVGGPTDPGEGQLTTLSRVDLERLGAQLDLPLYPVYVDLALQDPAQPADLPVPVPPPELSEGPHLGYAGQWFIFATLTVVVYALLLRRVARGRARSAPGPAPVPSSGGRGANP